MKMRAIRNDLRRNHRYRNDLGIIFRNARYALCAA
jgi:hypothetical protein